MWAGKKKHSTVFVSQEQVKYELLILSFLSISHLFRSKQVFFFFPDDRPNLCATHKQDSFHPFLRLRLFLLFLLLLLPILLHFWGDALVLIISPSSPERSLEELPPPTILGNREKKSYYYHAFFFRSKRIAWSHVNGNNDKVPFSWLREANFFGGRGRGE